MSAHPSMQVPATAAVPVSLPMLAEKKRLGEPVVMVTAYDFPSARAAEAAGVAANKPTGDGKPADDNPAPQERNLQAAASDGTKRGSLSADLEGDSTTQGGPAANGDER